MKPKIEFETKIETEVESAKVFFIDENKRKDVKKFFEIILGKNYVRINQDKKEENFQAIFNGIDIIANISGYHEFISPTENPNFVPYWGEEKYPGFLIDGDRKAKLFLTEKQNFELFETLQHLSPGDKFTILNSNKTYMFCEDKTGNKFYGLCDNKIKKITISTPIIRL